MQGSETTRRAWRKIWLAVVGFCVVLGSLALLFWYNITNSNQALPAFVLDVYFSGEYRIGNGEWKPIQSEEHISASQGDVTLKGQFHLATPDGEYVGVAGAGTSLAFYTDHICVAVQEQGYEPYVMDTESNYAGEGLCGVYCDAYILRTEEPITLTFHNNHRFGNENAIDHFLQQVAIYNDTTFEKDFMAQGNGQRNAGLAFVIVSFVLLGAAVFSSLLHIEGSGRLGLVGLCMFFAGGYFSYSSMGVFFWSDSVIGNTTILGMCMMLYMLCVSALITSTFDTKLRKIGTITTAFSGAVCTFLAVVCIATDVRFYDTWLWWTILQSLANVSLLVCLVLGLFNATKNKIANNIGAMILLLGFEADVVGTAFGWWQGGLICKCTFILLFLISLVLAWRVIPNNVNVARKNKELEAEQKEIRAQLQENRIAIMISQIQPHFIYNTLGTIQYLCKEDPAKAAQLVQNFSMYLRGNFSELDNSAPIRFTKELEHVRCYTDIELVRFPDMTVQYDIQTEDFVLPALSVQPLVENAIKHGLMGLEEGGTVTVTAYETKTHYCVKVADDGVGFNENCLQDGRKHVGIRNVRERLHGMCGGTLTVESQKGKGTVALIQIPKEGEESMIAIAVDDERPMLQTLVEAVSASSDIRQVHSFTSCSAALAWLETGAADVAFLDISMRGIGGLALAEKIGQLQPGCKIVFCTGYEQYALDAIQLRCSGYLIKPITAAAVQKELDHIKTQRTTEKLLTVKCFGTFEAFCNGQTLNFKRTKTKELLAVLVDRNGAGMTGKQICAVLWPEDSDDAKNMDYFRHLMKDLRAALEAVGAGSVLSQEQYQYRIDPEQITCDYHSYLKYGTPAFFGEYMSQYSWAEDTCGFLQK